MTETPITPLFAYPPQGPQFTIKDLTYALTSTGLSYPTANARIANYAAKRLIHVREKGVGTRPNIYEIHDMGAAVVLSALQDTGIADLDVLRDVSEALYAWPVTAKSPFVHPITAAVIGTAKGERWTFHLDVYRDTQTGERYLDPALFAEERHSIRVVPPTAVPIAAVLVTLESHLLPVARKLLPPVGH